MPVYAAEIVINEVFPNPSGPSTEETEFIELYNLSNGEIDISGYSLADNYSSYIIPEATMSAHGWLAFRKSQTGLRLSNSGDEVSLKNSQDEQIDYYSYSSSIEDRSYSRIPDGSGEFTADTVPTEAAANQTPSPSPTPNPSPSPTPSPSQTATATPSNPSPSPTPLAQISSSPTPRVIIDESSESETLSTDSKLMLGTISGEILGEIEETTESSTAVKPYQLSVWLIMVGLGLVGLTTWLWFRV